jgi:7-cyano-7-deazaguanine reductase
MPTKGELPSPDILETFPNPYPKRDYSNKMICEEFTSVCPKTLQPDFGRLSIRYNARDLCVELKSLKLYLQQYRNHGAFYEKLTNDILRDLVNLLTPHWMHIKAEFSSRGGIHSVIEVSYTSSEDDPPELESLESDEDESE